MKEYLLIGGSHNGEYVQVRDELSTLQLFKKDLSTPHLLDSCINTKIHNLRQELEHYRKIDLTCFKDYYVHQQTRYWGETEGVEAMVHSSINDDIVLSIQQLVRTAYNVKWSEKSELL